jgi:hypothetical protein
MADSRPILRVEPRDEADLLWVFNDAEGELKAMRSTWPQETRPQYERIQRAQGLRCGPVHVGSGSHSSQAREPDPSALYAAQRERRIWRFLIGAGPEAFEVLRLRYREPLRECRVVFGYTEPPPRRGRKVVSSIGAPRIALRGNGTLAHLTPSAHAAYDAARTTLALERWMDRLGNRLRSGSASVADRDLQRAVLREAEALLLRAYGRYRRGSGRLPEAVLRAGVAA